MNIIVFLLLLKIELEIFLPLPRHFLMVNRNNNRTCTMSFRICWSKFSFLQANLWTHEKDNLLFVYFQINTNLTDRQKGIGEYWWLTWKCFVANDRWIWMEFCFVCYCFASLITTISFSLIWHIPIHPALLSVFIFFYIFYKVIWDLLNDDDSLDLSMVWHEQSEKRAVEYGT